MKPTINKQRSFAFHFLLMLRKLTIMKSFILLVSFMLGLTQGAFSQTTLKNNTWNFHSSRQAGIETQYYHVGSFKSYTDTIISSDTFVMIKSSTGNIIDYLRQANGEIFYYFKGEAFKLFNVNRQLNDSFYVDMKFRKAINKDTIVKNVLIKITGIVYTKNITNTDSLKTFSYAILSSNVTSIYPRIAVPYNVPFPFADRLLSLHMSNYNEVSFTNLFNPYVNLGADSKPFLSCYENTTAGFSYKTKAFMDNNLACNFSTGLMNMNSFNHSITLYPNPANNYLYLTQTTDKATKITIYNLTGQSVLTEQINTQASPYQIDISSLLPGIYQSTIMDFNGLVLLANKFIKQ